MSKDKPLVYNYKKFGDFLRPVIYVNLHYKRQNASTLALVDSGADNCIFHAELGEILGIDIKSGKPLRIGGIASDGDSKPKAIMCYMHRIGITIKGQTRNINAFFSYDIANFGYSVLGQVGFFDMFKSVTFDYQNHQIVVQP